MFDRGNGPTGSCIQTDRVVVCAESWQEEFFSLISFVIEVAGGRKKKEKWEKRVNGGKVIVGAQKESVLRVDCLPKWGEAFPTSSEVACFGERRERKKATLHDKSEQNTSTSIRGSSVTDTFDFREFLFVVLRVFSN